MSHLKKCLPCLQIQRNPIKTTSCNRIDNKLKRIECPLPTVGEPIANITFSQDTHLLPDLEGDISSLILLLNSIGQTSIEVRDKIPFVQVSDYSIKQEFLKQEFLSPKQTRARLILLGDLPDRGPFGISILKTLQQLTLKLNLTIFLGNHDIFHLLKRDTDDCIPKSIMHPNNFKTPSDPAFELSHTLYTDLNHQRKLKLMEYDEDKKQLICHGVLTAGEEGFLKSSLAPFLKNTQAFKDFLETQGIKKETLETLIGQLNESDARVDTINMNNLTTVINLLIHPSFLKISDHKTLIIELLHNNTNSFLWVAGLHLKNPQSFTSMFNKDIYPLPGVTQINGHYHAESSTPVKLNVQTPIGSAALVKCDIKTSCGCRGNANAFSPSYYTFSKTKDAALSERRNSVFARQLTLERIAKNVEKTIKPKNPEENKLNPVESATSVAEIEMHHQAASKTEITPVNVKENLQEFFKESDLNDIKIKGMPYSFDEIMLELLKELHVSLR